MPTSMANGDLEYHHGADRVPWHKLYPQWRCTNCGVWFYRSEDASLHVEFHMKLREALGVTSDQL